MFLHDIVAPLTIDEAKATKTRLDPKCWKGKKIGNPKTKVKGGVRVNNCVPVEEDIGPDKNDPWEQGWRANPATAYNPYEQGTPEYAQWEEGQAERQAQPNHYDEGVAEGNPDVMRHAGDTTIRVVKKGGVPIGEIGIDAEASSGNGQYYVKLYDGSYDAVGFDTAEEALAELKLAIKSVAEATGDVKFDKMLKGITGKKEVAKQQKTDTKQQARDAFGGMFGGGNPTDKLSIRKSPGVAEGKGLAKKVKIVKGPDAGKTGWVREIKHGAFKGAPKSYYIDLDDGGQANNIPGTALRLVKDPGVAEGYAGVDDTDTVGFSVNTEAAYTAVMKRFGDVIDHDETSGVMYAPARVWPQIEMVAFDADGEGATRDDGIDESGDVEDFLARGGKITQVKPNKGPRYPGTSLGSKHIGTTRGGKASTISGKNANTRATVKPVVAVEADRNEMDTPEFQAAIAKMAAKHKDEKWSKEQLTALGKRLAARGAAERKTKGVDEDSWNDGQNAWSSENNQWSNESVEDRRLNRLIEYRLAEMRRAGYDI